MLGFPYVEQLHASKKETTTSTLSCYDFNTIECERKNFLRGEFDAIDNSHTVCEGGK